MRNQAAKNAKRQALRDAHRAQHSHAPRTPESIADQLSRDIRSVVMQACRPRTEQSLFPVDIQDLASEIQVKGWQTVTNKQRNMLAKGLPVGSMTPRDGKSVASHLRNDWD